VHPRFEGFKRFAFHHRYLRDRDGCANINAFIRYKMNHNASFADFTAPKRFIRPFDGVRAGEFAKQPGFEPMEQDHPPALPGFKDMMVLRNHQSYGMAYLANDIHYVEESKVAPLEHAVRRYLTHNNENPSAFREARTWFYGELDRLKNKHDILLESPERPKASAPPGDVLIRNILGQATVMKADCQRDECELVYNLVNQPGWYAYADGKPLQISRANFAFMAVALPRGAHEVWFIYTPTSFLCFTFLSLISLIALPFLPRR